MFDYNKLQLSGSHLSDDAARLSQMRHFLVSCARPELSNVSVADPRRKSVTIEGLQPDQVYVFSVSALTKEGPGLRTSITVKTTINCEFPNIGVSLTKLSTPVHGLRFNPTVHLVFPPVDFAHLAKILIPTFLLLGCIILLWPQRNT